MLSSARPQLDAEDPRPEDRYTLAAAQVVATGGVGRLDLPALAPPMGLSATAGDSGGCWRRACYAIR